MDSDLRHPPTVIPAPLTVIPAQAGISLRRIHSNLRRRDGSIAKPPGACGQFAIYRSPATVFVIPAQAVMTGRRVGDDGYFDPTPPQSNAASRHRIGKAAFLFGNAADVGTDQGDGVDFAVGTGWGGLLFGIIGGDAAGDTAAGRLPVRRARVIVRSLVSHLRIKRAEM